MRWRWPRWGWRGAKVHVAGNEPTPVRRLLRKGKEAVQKATIEAKALRHGVKVGLRMARRVSKRVRDGEGLRGTRGGAGGGRDRQTGRGAEKAFRNSNFEVRIVGA